MTNDSSYVIIYFEELKRYICVSMAPRRRKIGDIDILPYQQFLTLLWDGAYA